jgi:hypothetical protein
MAEKDKVIGKALYAEFRSGSQTYQLMITPDGINSGGKYVPAMVYRRQISANRPRRAWKSYSLPSLNVNEFGAFTTMPKDQAIEAAKSRLEFMMSTVNQMAGYKYQLYKLPIVVEVASEDLDGIRLGKTPYKVLGRITRVRKALGFSEELFIS